MRSVATTTVILILHAAVLQLWLWMLATMWTFVQTLGELTFMVQQIEV